MPNQNSSSQVPPSNVPPNVAFPPGPTPKPKWYHNRKILTVAIVVLVLLIGAGLYAAFGRQLPGSLTGKDGIFGELPLAEELQEQVEEVIKNESGLSGMKCDHPNRRAIGVMLAGDPINRPISGFAKADLVLEMPALVSDVTRLTGFYQCQEPAEIGSVRSARHDYLFMAEGWDAILGHWGGSYHALNRIAAGEFQSINALSNPFNAYFRKSTLPAPYNGFTSYERMWNALVQLGYRQETKFEGYDFKDDPAPEDRGPAGILTIAWPGQFRVHYEYDPATNRYVRYWAGVKQIDGEDGKSLNAPSVVVIIRAANQLAAGEGGYNEMAIEGEGPAEIYQDGKVIKGTWKKNVLYKNDPTHFFDEEGNEITFTRGQLWVMAVEPTISVAWSPTVTTAPATPN